LKLKLNSSLKGHFISRLSFLGLQDGMSEENEKLKAEIAQMIRPRKLYQN
jgi:hypothetical protein